MVNEPQPLLWKLISRRSPDTDPLPAATQRVDALPWSAQLDAKASWYVTDGAWPALTFSVCRLPSTGSVLNHIPANWLPTAGAAATGVAVTASESSAPTIPRILRPFIEAVPP